MTVDEITALLVNKFSGVRKDGLAHVARLIALQATTEEEIQALVSKMDADKVTETVREYRKNVDKEVTDATKTHEANLKKKFEFREKVNSPMIRAILITLNPMILLMWLRLSERLLPKL